MLSPFQYAYRQPGTLARLISPQLITSLGAGLLIPFLNLFFNEVHQRPVAEVGRLFSYGSLAMGIGLLLAPPLAERFGKIRIVVITQALSIPFLILLGFAPWYWVSAIAFLVRAALMNMSSPVYNAFVMEEVEPEARATVASLASMSWNFGWTFSPTISGWVQVNYGFSPLFIGTITTYVTAIWMYWRFFLSKGKHKAVRSE
jgi:MFS family permease